MSPGFKESDALNPFSPADSFGDVPSILIQSQKNE
jgi:hypothetical protein